MWKKQKFPFQNQFKYIIKKMGTFPGTAQARDRQAKLGTVKGDPGSQ